MVRTRDAVLESCIEQDVPVRYKGMWELWLEPLVLAGGGPHAK